MNDCTCGHPANEHIWGLCLWTVECLCRGFEDVEAFLDSLPDELLSDNEVEAIVAWIHTRTSPVKDKKPSQAAACPVCAGPPDGQLVGWGMDLMPVERRAWQAWYAQPCVDCGKALAVHQTYRHPHGGIGKGWQCGAFRPVREEMP